MTNLNAILIPARQLLGENENKVADSTSKRARVESLDYLRGVLAVGVMLYHYKLWSGVNYGYPMEQFFQRVGIYGVCTFYVLSGMSLGIVYGKRQMDKEFLIEFAVKRFFRIAPLFWAATTLTIILRWVLFPPSTSGGLPPHHILLAILNYSLSFGWLRPDLYIAAGAWSIGNELVFYSLLPGLLVLMRRSRVSLVTTFAIALGVCAAFAFGVLDRSTDLDTDEQWRLYINPLNQVFLFVAGVALAITCDGGSKRPIKMLVLVLLLCFGIFVFWPTNGLGGTAIVTNFERLLFCGLSCAFCYVALKWHGNYGRLAGAFAWIGNISYSVYLLHPILYYLFRVINEKALHTSVVFAAYFLALPATILCAMISWRFLEKPLIHASRRIVGALPNKSRKRVVSPFAT